MFSEAEQAAVSRAIDVLTEFTGAFTSWRQSKRLCQNLLKLLKSSGKMGFWQSLLGAPLPLPLAAASPCWPVVPRRGRSVDGGDGGVVP
jgi:hypothetical protein